MHNSHIPSLATADMHATKTQHICLGVAHKGKHDKPNLLNIEFLRDAWGELSFQNYDDAVAFAKDTLSDEELADIQVLFVSDAFCFMNSFVVSHLTLVDKRFAINLDYTKQHNDKVFFDFYDALAEQDIEDQEMLIASLAQACTRAEYDPLSDEPLARGIGFDYLSHVASCLGLTSPYKLSTFMSFEDFIKFNINNLQYILADLTEP